MLATIVCLAPTLGRPRNDLQGPDSREALSVSSADTAEEWVSIGPAGELLPTPPLHPGGYSGRVSDIAVDPLNADHWVIGASLGGVWETWDGGASWTPLADGEATQAIGAVAIHINDPNIIYAGTGEWWEGLGVLKSTDGGMSWQLLGTSTLARLRTTELRVDPANPDTVLVSTKIGGSGRLRSLPAIPKPVTGVYRSVDGGSTWARVVNGESVDLEVDPRDFSRQFAGVQGPDPNTRGVYRSADGGQTWTRLAGPWSSIPQNIRDVEMAVAPTRPDTIYIGISYQGAPNRLWRTNSAWADTPVWGEMNLSSSPDLSSYLGFEMIVDPVNWTTVYIGDIDLFRFDGPSSTPVLITPPHVDVRAMAFTGTMLISGDDGGVHTSTNGGLSWNTRNDGLSNASFYGGAIHPAADFALGGVHDNGVLKWTGTPSWQRIAFGDGAQAVISRHDPDRDWAYSTSGGSSAPIFRTIDNGATFTDVRSGIDPNESTYFDSPFGLCPADSDIMVLFTSTRPWRSEDFFSNPAGPTWLPNGPKLFISLYKAFAFAEADPTCSIYATARNNLLRLTTNGGATWTEFAATHPLRRITDLAFDPRDPNVLYMACDGFDAGTPASPGHLFRTTNLLSGSPTFTNISPPVDLPINTVLLDPAYPDKIFAGSDRGVWKSPDLGATWIHMGPATGLPNAAVFDLQASPAGRIAAFTNGRGVYILNRIAGCPAGPGADGDFDGVGNSCDNCTALPNPLQTESDGDAEGDACDCDDADASLPSDDDSDGFTMCTGDCDDTRDSVGPGAPQLCDDLNNDCSDPVWPVPPPNDADQDADGFKPCTGDCDDTRAGVRPGGPQICDDLNNDCSDPAWPAPPPNDADDDTDGFTECGGDCDDESVSTHPGASEVNDGMDNQCPGDPGHGSIDELTGLEYPDAVDTDHLCWAAQPGATSYTVARASDPSMTTGLHCAEPVITACDDDTATPALGAAFFYLVRAYSPFAGSWGRSSAGSETVVACPGS